MTTFLKIALIALVMWWLLHNAPIIMAPVFGMVLMVIGFAAMLLVALTLGVTVGLAAVIVLLAVACSIAAALAPVWLPLLAIAGIVALCRQRRPVSS